MSLIRIENVSKSFSGETVLESVRLRIENGEKIGLIGRNGSGKSTIFRILTGEIEADTGVVERNRRARIACLAQLPSVPKETSILTLALDQFRNLQEMEIQLRELEARLERHDESALEEYSTIQDDYTVHGGYEYRSRAERVLTGLGFSQAEFALHYGALSGGQRTRMMLALILLEDADLLLLDEPENHLDMHAREWLEGFLSDWPRAFVIISHDRRMLNAVTNRTIEVERGELRGFSGNYEAYIKEKVRFDDDRERAYKKQQEYIVKEEAWINRFRYKNTKAKQVQSRIKRLEKLERIVPPESDEAAAGFSLGEVVRSGQSVLEAKKLSMRYDDLVLYENLSFTVERGERVGIIGPNGSGKTTLLRHITGTLSGGTGEISLGHKVNAGYYDQQHEGLNSSRTVLDEVMAARPDWMTEKLRTFLGRFLFRGEDVFKEVGSLSGGERSRVAMAKLILGGANLLILDEPTNHLDIASREALEEALMSYPGSMIIVSHDRVLVDRLVDKLVIVENGKASVYLGNYTHYRWKQGEAARQETDSSDAMKIRRTESPPKPAIEGREARKNRKRLRTLESTIAQVEGISQELEEKLADVDPTDFSRLAEVTGELDGVKGDLKELYGEWETIAQELGAT